jgi:hypothetical protein
MQQNAYPGAPSAAAPAAGIIPSIRCPSEDLNPGMRGLGQVLKFLRFLMTVNNDEASDTVEVGGTVERSIGVR